jgi:hypothetical protein
MVDQGPHTNAGEPGLEISSRVHGVLALLSYFRKALVPRIWILLFSIAQRPLINKRTDPLSDWLFQSHWNTTIHMDVLEVVKMDKDGN